jgi:hypothetical protein
MTGAVMLPPGVVGVAVGVLVRVSVAVAAVVFVGVAVAGLGVFVAGAVVLVGVAGTGVLVGAEAVPQVATISLLETRDVVSRAPLHFRRKLSPGCMVAEDEAANAAMTPSASMAARPIAPGRSCRRIRETPGVRISRWAGSHWHIRRSLGDVRACFGNPSVKTSVTRGGEEAERWPPGDTPGSSRSTRPGSMRLKRRAR